MDEAQVPQVVEHIRVLVEAHYIYPDIAAKVSRVLAEGLADGRYPAEEPALAKAVTADLQSINGDKHLRLLHHAEALPQRTLDDDTEEYAAMARWADQTCGGVACVQRLAGNVGYLDLQPILFPTALCGEIITAAMSLLATTDVLIIDLRHCLGGEPTMAAFLISYVWDHEPAQLTGLQDRKDNLFKQAWTLPYVPGRRFGKAKPVYVLTSATTFSGGEQLSYDLQQLGRATIIGERTRGGAHAREGFTVDPHLEATIPVAASVNPKTGGNWEGTGVAPDIQATAGQARATAYKLALQDVIAADGPATAEARGALAAAQADTA
jgi:C-terminal processing protease CtpA/Prc